MERSCSSIACLSSHFYITPKAKLTETYTCLQHQTDIDRYTARFTEKNLNGSLALFESDAQLLKLCIICTFYTFSP